MVPNVVMAKVNLKDAYLTVPVAPPLPFGNPKQKQGVPPIPAIWTLHRSIHVFKVDKASNSQIGIHIIIYLNDMLLVSPTERSLVQQFFGFSPALGS